MVAVSSQLGLSAPSGSEYLEVAAANRTESRFLVCPDPQRLFLFLPPQVGFEDVIAEPVSAHSFDRVWIGSHAAFELVKFLFYRLLSTLLAVPLAFVLGLLFGLLSCIHIW